MEPLYKSKIETPTDSYVAHYPWATEMAIKQQSLFWPAEELGVEQDEQDFRIGLNASEKHGVFIAQSILTQYELMIGGEELWGGKIARLFPRPEIQRMCACFANVELGSHAPFYDIGNKVMGNSNDDFYSSWKLDPVLAQRIAFIGKSASSTCALEVTAALAFMEGAILFVAFGFFKGFNSRGHNMISHFVSGIDGSAKDENYHSLASAGLFNVCRAERIANGQHTEEDDIALRHKINELAITVYAHEKRIAAKMFEIPGNRVVTEQEVVEFAEDRINIVLARLNMPPMFNRPIGEISKWFYQQLSSVKIPDFFANTQLQYTRNWKKHELGFRSDIAAPFISKHEEAVCV